MKVYGISEISEFLGDFVVYRNLEPVDPRLPGLGELRVEAGLPGDVIPRKSQPDYRARDRGASPPSAPPGGPGRADRAADFYWGYTPE